MTCTILHISPETTLRAAEVLSKRALAQLRPKGGVPLAETVLPGL
jgi:hypothetical protein